jgi:hypothetical protein
MSQNTSGFPEGRPIQYSAPQIPKKQTPWLMKALIAFAVLLLIGVAYGFWRISNVPTPTIDTAPMDSPAAPAPRTD